MSKLRTDMPDLCLHCECAPRENYLRLCNQCAGQRGLRRIYQKTASWTPEHDARVQALVEKAKRQEPLFDPKGPYLHCLCFDRPKPCQGLPSVKLSSSKSAVLLPTLTCCLTMPTFLANQVSKTILFDPNWKSFDEIRMA